MTEHVRLVRATVNLHDLPAGRYAWIDWPPTEYVARMIAASYLTLESPPRPKGDDDEREAGTG